LITAAALTMVTSLGIIEDGAMHVWGLRQRAKEHAEVCAALLEVLREPGLDTGRRRLWSGAAV
jgi:hypothetical protein